LVKPESKLLLVDDLDIKMTGISIDFTPDSMFANSSIDSLIFNASDIVSNDLKDHELSIGNIHYDISDQGFTIEKFHIKNKKSRKAYNAGREYRSPWIEVDVEEITFDIFPWDIYNNGIYNINKILLTQPDINLFVDLNLPLSPKIKPMPSKMIRSVPINFNIDTLQLVDASFIFMPKMKGENPGNVKLAPINGYITNITNISEYLASDPLMKLDVETKIWDEGDVDIYIEIDIPNKNDPMYVKGQVVDLSLIKVENMIKNLFGIGIATGHLDLLKFEYQADDVTSRGEVVFDYRNLVLDVKKRDRKNGDKGNSEAKYKEKSSRFFNFFVKEAVIVDNIPGSEKYIPVGYIYRDRVRDKAFSDALWGSIEVGVFDIAVKDTYFDSKRNYNKQGNKKAKQEKKEMKREESAKNKSKDNDSSNKRSKKKRKKK
jgi:hypothetical protein